MLRDHVSSQLLGRTTAGTLTLNQDSKGLAFTVTLPNAAIAEDTAENVRNGNLNSCSFGFNVPSGGDKWSSTPDGAVLRKLLDVNLSEISVTSFAAYPATSISLRHAPPEIRGLITRSNLTGATVTVPNA
jgi:HK97 family phage prohead protease